MIIIGYMDHGWPVNKCVPDTASCQRILIFCKVTLSYIPYPVNSHLGNIQIFITMKYLPLSKFIPNQKQVKMAETINRSCNSRLHIFPGLPG